MEDSGPDSFNYRYFILHGDYRIIYFTYDGSVLYGWLYEKIHRTNKKPDVDVLCAGCSYISSLICTEPVTVKRFK
jgi:hypothetical protein